MGVTTETNTVQRMARWAHIGYSKVVMIGRTWSKKKRMILATAVFISLLIVGSVTWFIANHRDSGSSPFSSGFVHSVDFPLYYPSLLPAGYTLDSNTGSTTDTAYYNLVNTVKKRTITVTMQATPSDFDAAKIIGSASIPTSIMPSGTLYDLSIGSESKYMFTTGEDTLLFITSSGKIPASDIDTITRNMQKIEE